MAATIATINTTTRAPTAPRMPPRRREEGLLVGVTVVGPVTALEDTGALMVPSAMVVMVGITAGCRVNILMMEKTLHSIYNAFMLYLM